MQLRRFTQSILALLALATAIYALGFLANYQQDPAPSAMIRRAIFPWAIPAHIIGGSLALLVGVPQTIFRRRVPIAWHRRLGYLYALAILVSSSAGLLLAQTAEGGLIARSGFSLLALLSLSTTFYGVLAARQGKLFTHRRFLSYSFALSCAAITLRIELPTAIILGWTFDQAYPCIAWLCWIPNLAFAHWLVAKNARPA